MKVTLISPNILTQKGDLFGSGIPYMPVMLVYLAGYLRSKGFDVGIIDAFGMSPSNFRVEKNYIVHGLSISEIIQRLPGKTDVICIYAESVVTHPITLDLISKIRAKDSSIPIIILENTQSVVAYSLKNVTHEFLSRNADYVILGELEIRTEKLLGYIRDSRHEKKIDGVIYKRDFDAPVEMIENISDFDSIPYPAWDLMPLENYWNIGYGHGPISSRKYLPLITSRGCTFSCAFCVIPETNKKKWRARSPMSVANEIAFCVNTFNVREFHIEDLNPTLDKKRIIEICKEIQRRKLDVIWKLVSGTKIETLDENTLYWMKKAGCKYISFSPESGSARVLKMMKKPFNHAYSLEMANKMHILGIKSQACFVLGYPGETNEDRKDTEQFIKRMASCGVDEIALFIMTPIPGSEIFGKVIGYKGFEELTFSPSWRSDFITLNSFRMKAYAKFFFWKLIYHPIDSLKSVSNIFRRSFELKIEMTIYRIFLTSLGYITGPWSMHIRIN